MRNNKIQILRAIAIIAVVIIHSYPENYWGIYLRAVVNYAVALFLFCSGYLTKLEYSDIGKFYRKRIVRIGIPYLIWTFIYMLKTISTYPTFILIIKNYLYIAWKGNANKTMYFVIVYIGLVLFTPLIGKMAKSKFKHIGWFATPVYMILRRYIPLITGMTIIPSYLSCFQFLEWFTFYYLGILLGNNVIKFNKTRTFTISIYVITLIISIGEGLIWNRVGNYSMATTQHRLSSLLSSSVACLLAYQYLKSTKEVENNLLTKTLIMIGDYSFGIYLSHMGVLSLLSKSPVYQKLMFPLNSLSVLLCTLIALILVNKFFNGKLNSILGIR